MKATRFQSKYKGTQFKWNAVWSDYLNLGLLEIRQTLLLEILENNITILFLLQYTQLLVQLRFWDVSKAATEHRFVSSLSSSTFVSVVANEGLFSLYW